MKKIFLYTFLIGQLCFSTLSHAVIIPRAIGNDSRIKIVNYAPNKSVRFVGHYNYNSIIEFETGETIQTITMGDSKSWQLNPAENRIFLKPIAQDATTNMTVITNRRTYFFEMHAEYADGITDPRLSFMVKFMYPDNQTTTNIVPGMGGITSDDAASGPDLNNPGKYNFKYRISGNGGAMEPILLFDDGAFTYFKFKDINADIPAIFLVGQDEHESLINYRVTDGYIVVERVAKKFTLRHGRTITCVFNENHNTPISVPSVKTLNNMQQPSGGDQMNQSGAVMSAPGVPIVQAAPTTNPAATAQVVQ